MVKKTVLALIGGFFLLESVVHSVLNEIPNNIRLILGGILIIYGLFSKEGGKLDIPIVSDFFKK